MTRMGLKFALLGLLAMLAPATRALDPLPHEVLNGTGWAQAATALALWMLLPLAVGTWRITRREVAS